MAEKVHTERTLAQQLKAAFVEWKSKLPEDRGFNHHEGLAFMETLESIALAHPSSVPASQETK